MSITKNVIKFLCWKLQKFMSHSLQTKNFKKTNLSSNSSTLLPSDSLSYNSHTTASKINFSQKFVVQLLTYFDVQ